MITDTLKQLMTFIQNAAPVVWEAAYRQVYVNIAQDVIAILFMIVLCFVFLRVIKKMEKVREKDHYADAPDIVIPLSWVVIVVAIVVSFFCLLDASGKAINPTWFAIQNILQFVGK